MNAKDQHDLALRLRAALKRAGIVVSRGLLEGGNIRRWEEVSPDAALFVWLQKGWRVDVVEPTPTDQRTLELL